MTSDPSRYAWIKHSPMAASGCLTVVAEPDVAGVKAAFGCEEAAPEPEHAASLLAGDELYAALLGPVGGGLILAEDNGFQGSRREVLGPASRASGTGKAASIYWSDGEVVVSCARRGKVLCVVELGGPSSEIHGLPVALRRLVDVATEAGADRVATGAAMVEAFTGVPFTPEDLSRAQLCRLMPPPAALLTAGGENGTLSSEPELRSAILALPDTLERRLAEWLARAAVREADLESAPPVASLMRQLGRDRPSTLTPALEALAARVDREASEWARRFDDAGFPVESNFVNQKHWAVEAVRYTSHPDAASAALLNVEHARLVFANTRTERGVTMVEDETGRYAVFPDLDLPSGRTGELDAALARVLRADVSEWDALLLERPAPLTAAQRSDAVHRDRARAARGDYQGWQIG